ncbi:MAG: helicase C-terminal domain-containing protein [Bacteriovoracaceae bacterium]
MTSLGKWAILDIETTGLDSSYDKIIDVGFLQFDGTQLVKKYSSLVQFPTPDRPEDKLSHYIEKLTGISQAALIDAPIWKAVEDDVLELEGHHILAHNAEFEKSFLMPSFERYSESLPSFCDSMPFLSLVFTHFESLKLERFITYFGLRDSEVHRGYEDSLDLLKVLLLSIVYLKEDPENFEHLKWCLRAVKESDFWIKNLLELSNQDLEELSESIDFDIYKVYAEFKESLKVELPESVIDHQASTEFNGENVASILRDEASIQKYVPNYSYRDAQEKLAIRVGQSFKSQVHALIQAPTGTGKTLGYLLPSSLYSISESKQVLVATGTKALQHQIISKDVTQLRKILGLDEGELRIKRLVGSSNHFCELLFRQKEESGELPLVDTFDQEFYKIYLERLFYHNSHDKNPIYLNNVPYVLRHLYDDFEKNIYDVLVDFRACTGKKCPYKGNCSYINDLKEAKDAHLIIGNHALMFSWPKGLARPAHIIVDEAHKIEGETTRAFSHELSYIEVKSLINNLKNKNGIGSLFYLLSQNEEFVGQSTPLIKELQSLADDTAKLLEEVLESLPQRLEDFFKKRPRYSEIYWNESPMMDEKAGGNFLGAKIFKNFNEVQTILKSLWEKLYPHSTRFDINQFESDTEIIAYTRFETFMGHLFDYLETLDLCLSNSEKFCRSIKYHEKYGFLISASPIDTGEKVFEGLLNTSSSVVFTSATLSNVSGTIGEKGMEWATGYNLLAPEKRFKKGLFLPPIYDYGKKAKVILCDDVPQLWETEFVPNIFRYLIPMIEDLGGRSLLLFSSKVRFETAREILLERFKNDIPLFIQGMGENVVEEFKEHGKGVLLGMESFGEGIDVPGDTLRFVFIDKIPDLPIEQVINERRDFYQRSLGNEFVDYYLSHRSRSLHQKLGRLLRTNNDLGGAIIVDSRVKKWKGRTMEKFYQLMKPYEITRLPLKNACHEIKDFILEKGSNYYPEDHLNI